jgi:hypothetical protein
MPQFTALPPTVAVKVLQLEAVRVRAVAPVETCTAEAIVVAELGDLF